MAKMEIFSVVFISNTDVRCPLAPPPSPTSFVPISCTLSIKGQKSCIFPVTWSGQVDAHGG